MQQLRLKRTEVLEEIRDSIYRQANEFAQFRLSMEKLSAETMGSIADLDERLTAFQAESRESLSRTDSRIGSVSSEAQRQTHQLAEVRLWLEKISSETTNAFTHVDSHLATLKVESLNALWEIGSKLEDAVDRQANELVQFRFSMEKLSAETTRAIADLDERLTALKAESLELLSRTNGRLGSMSSEAQRQTHQLAEVRLLLEKISSESTHAFAHVDSRMGTLKAESLNALWEIGSRLQSASGETSNALWTLKGEIGSRFNDLVNVVLPQCGSQSHTAAALLLEQAAQLVDRRRWAVQIQEQYAPAKPMPFDKSMAVVQIRYPEVFAPWQERLGAVLEAMKATRIGNAANDVDLYSRMYKSFVQIHAHGRVLDVGCGPYGRPYYLQSYPADLISAIEPLPMMAPAEFECVRGLNEMLPWPDAAFSTVINATSLDHVLSLETSLDEMSRVLRPGGTLLLWISSIPGSPPYRPTSPDFVPIDRYHLFHFDVAWFAPMLATRFETLQCLEFATAAFSHVFYALRPR